MVYTAEQLALLLKQAGPDDYGNLLLWDIAYQYGKEVVVHLDETRYNVSLYSYWKHEGQNHDTEKEWNDLRLYQITSRWWYFRRFAAKKQLEEPLKIFGFLITRTVSKENQEAYLAKKYKDKLSAAKAKLTKITNSIELAEKKWNSLFPITEDANYQKAKSMLFTQRNLIAEIEAEIKSIS